MPAERTIEHAIGAESSSRHLERWAGELAGRQHGVVGRQQLLAAGFTRRAIGHRIGRGRLYRISSGVYAIGHRALSTEGRWMAAVLAGGPSAVLSHRAAAYRWWLIPYRSIVIDVTSAQRVRVRESMRFHRRRLPSDEVTVERGIPVTTVPRTLFDLASVLAPRRVERAITEAEVRRLSDSLSLADLARRYRGHRGTGVIRTLLAAGRIGAEVTRSELEERFLSFLEGHGLPRPEVNAGLEVRGAWLEVDCLWRSSRVIVELDGRAAHSTAAAFEHDRSRDRALAGAGWHAIRITWRQLHDEPEAVAADLRRVLGRPAA